MIYTRAMIETLNRLDLPTRALLMYYLDKYYKDFEEPEFASYELSKAWYLLLTDGLCEEIRTNASHTVQALDRLKQLIDINSAWYLPHYQNEPKLKTIVAGTVFKEKGKIKREKEKAKKYEGV